MSLLGVYVASRVGSGSGVESLETKLVGAALVLGGLGYLAKAFIRGGVQSSDLPFLLSTRDRIIAFTLGATCGFVVGLTSVGSGTFFGLVMLLVFPLTAQKIVGTDIFHAAALLWVAGIGHLVAGDVNLHAMAWLLTGSIPGILLGSQMSIQVPERALRISFSIILCLSGIKLLNAPYSSEIVVGALGVGAVILTIYSIRQVYFRRPPSLAERAAASTTPGPEQS
jgi:uncharacterized membrane protein YfcA